MNVALTCTATFAAKSPAYGKISGTITNDGVVNITGGKPSISVDKWHLSGTITPDGGTLAFEITPDGDGKLQSGTFTIAKIFA